MAGFLHVRNAPALKDQDGRSIFYNGSLREAAVKLLAMKAAWQVEKLKAFQRPVMIFLDEPGLGGFGSSAVISISKQDVLAVLGEVIQGITDRGALCGVHVCDNTEWSLLLDAAPHIISFDAYGFFDKFILFRDRIAAFIRNGGVIAWGLIPTGDAGDIQRQTPESLAALFESQVRRLTGPNLDQERIFRKSLISPSCGTGALNQKDALRVLEMTAAVSKIIREKYSLTG